MKLISWPTFLFLLNTAILCGCTGAINQGKATVKRSDPDPIGDQTHTSLDYSETALNTLVSTRSLFNQANPENVTPELPNDPPAENPCKPPKKGDLSKKTFKRAYKNCVESSGTSIAGNMTYSFDDKDFWTITGNLTVQPKNSKAYGIEFTGHGSRLKNEDGTFRFADIIQAVVTLESGSEYADAQVVTGATLSGTNLNEMRFDEIRLNRVHVKTGDLPVYFQISAADKVLFSEACSNPVGKFRFKLTTKGTAGDLTTTDSLLQIGNIHHNWSQTCTK